MSRHAHTCKHSFTFYISLVGECKGCSYFFFDFVLKLSSPVCSCLMFLVFSLVDDKWMKLPGDWLSGFSVWCYCGLHSYLSSLCLDSVLGRKTYVFTPPYINGSTVISGMQRAGFMYPALCNVYFQCLVFLTDWPQNSFIGNLSITYYAISEL